MRHRLVQRLAVLCASATLVIGSTLAAGTAAHASPSSLDGCRNPYVCVYEPHQVMVGAYKDVTPYWQTFSRSDVTYVYNARHHGAVYFLYSSGYTSCAEPGRQASLYHRGYGNVTGIRIDTGPHCYA
ncbi:hypothetical protein OG194_46975 [Streptomyces sp. NBC_01288]|uniref:hypothetical protein n=1 Tax=Streptomyces sp. NBC_01288 TaxID=2903814 RepID=UPI002E1337B4|nr:hypothetical protein OG194_46975 [Streptomyces sp. NBC_01288]